MYDHLTAQGRAVIANAQAAALAYNHDYVGTEHILIGLLRTPCVASEVLQSFGITANKVDAKVRELVGVGSGTGAAIPPGAQAPLAPHGHQLIESSREEARTLGHEHVDAEHILLALLSARDGTAAQILLDAGTDHDAMRSEVLHRIAAPAAPSQLAAPPSDQVQDGIRVEYAPELKRLLRVAGARALDDGRAEVDGLDLLLALTRDDTAGALLAELGVDDAAVREAVERRRDA